ncbi:hypothetical protein [Sediminicoccus sp. KRV36]|uniref:hypothetical protein n=1 Tax=Sediminicoccus sp. KRV36 TaxID=3133721 RepID=UPI00200C12C0|nr:hypothetical protein [Sediminicoccus rosea]UPY37223.1 hypothetical protein LHU95_00585 [Sediminicoccus rosea]
MEELRTQLEGLGLAAGEVAAEVYSFTGLLQAETYQRLAARQAAEAQRQAEAEAAAQARAMSFKAANDNLLSRAIRVGLVAGDADAFDAARRASAEIRSLTEELENLRINSDGVAAAVASLTAIQAAEADQARKAALAGVTVGVTGLSPQALQAAAGGALATITSLRNYVGSFSTTGAGAGTALDRLSGSLRQFDAVFGAASAGDANSLSGLQNAAEAYRVAAREVYGGGQGFADAVRLITERVGSVADLGPETLTQSFIAENAREQTDRLMQGNEALLREVAALRQDIILLMMRPAA